MKPLMTHVVAGYPRIEETYDIVNDMIKQRVAAIEIQIPFSDPAADGPVLMRANDQALQQGASRHIVYQLLKAIDFKSTKVYLMCYYQSLYQKTTVDFLQQSISANCAGFIIPDLPFDSPDMASLLLKIPELRSDIVPVVSPGITLHRLKKMKDILTPHTIYVTARKGITGSTTLFNSELLETTRMLRQLFPNSVLAIGFGIKNNHDVNAALQYGDIAVVGSALTTAYEKAPDEYRQLLQELYP